MTVILNPYLSFRDTAREAMTFYQSVLGGELVVTTFGEFPDMMPPDEADKVMHAQLTSPTGLTLMAADTPASREFTRGNDVAVSISGDDEDAISTIWTGLAESATVTMPFEVAPWGDRFGMLTDRFGVDWSVSSSVSNAA